MKQEKLEQWITKREIQKHAKSEVKQYKGRKTFTKGLLIDLDKPRNETEKISFAMMIKYN